MSKVAGSLYDALRQEMDTSEPAKRPAPNVFGKLAR